MRTFWSSNLLTNGVIDSIMCILNRENRRRYDRSKV